FMIRKQNSSFGTIKFLDPAPKALETSVNGSRKVPFVASKAFLNAKRASDTQVSLCYTTGAKLARYGFFYTLDGTPGHVDPAITNGATTGGGPGIMAPGQLRACQLP